MYVNKILLLKNHNFFKVYNSFCIPGSFNTNISHQFFEYTITFVNSQHYNINSKGDFVLKTRFETFVLWNSGIQK